MLLGDQVAACLPSGSNISLQRRQNVEEHHVERHAVAHEPGHEVVERARVAGDGRGAGSQSGLGDAGFRNGRFGVHWLHGI